MTLTHSDTNKLEIAASAWTDIEAWLTYQCRKRFGRFIDDFAVEDLVSETKLLFLKGFRLDDDVANPRAWAQSYAKLSLRAAARPFRDKEYRRGIVDVPREHNLASDDEDANPFGYTVSGNPFSVFSLDDLATDDNTGDHVLDWLLQEQSTSFFTPEEDERRTILQDALAHCAPTLQRVVEYICRGDNRATAARNAGVHPVQVHRWVESLKNIVQEMDAAQQENRTPVIPAKRGSAVASARRSLPESGGKVERPMAASVPIPVIPPASTKVPARDVFQLNIFGNFDSVPPVTTRKRCSVPSYSRAARNYNPAQMQLFA